MSDEETVDLEPRETDAVEAEVQVRDAALREVEFRIMPWNTPVNTVFGPEEFDRGAFAEVDPKKVLLMGPEHEAHFGVGQDGKPRLTRRPIGRGKWLEERDDGAYMGFRVAATQAGDEYLVLAQEGVIDSASVEFVERLGGTRYTVKNGRRHKVHARVDLPAVSPTYRPAYPGAAVIAVRSAEEEEEPMATSTKAVQEDPAPEPTPPDEPQEPEKVPEGIQARSIQGYFDRMDASLADFAEKFVSRLESVEERTRSQFIVPAVEDEAPSTSIGEWTALVFKLLSGDRIPESQMRTVADLITPDNAGVVPEAFVSELRGVIDPSRPFMESTRQLPMPTSGTSMRVPKITQRPTVAEQEDEKDELSSQKTIITSETFEMKTKGGVGDLSLQLLKRSDPSFLDLYVRLLAEAYAIETDDEAVHELIDAIGSVGAADPMDPENLALGASFQTSFDAIRRPPDTIWLSTEAVGSFIDAKATGTNAPLYPGLQASATAAGGITGTISGLRPVHVPALDAHGAYAIVGPSSGFAWAEDGTYTLQVDVPARAGRDVSIVGMVWFVPWYPDAFSLYNVAS
jgi:phage head maturation protease